jgi:hypothetical protein
MKRPVIVSVIAIITIVIGAFQVLFGSIMLAKRNDADFLIDAKATSSDVTSVGTVMVVFGALAVLVGIGLWRGSRLARLLYAVLAVGQIVGGIYTIVKLDSSQRASGIGTIVGSLILLYLLYGTEKARAFFAR